MKSILFLVASALLLPEQTYAQNNCGAATCNAEPTCYGGAETGADGALSYYWGYPTATSGSKYDCTLRCSNGNSVSLTVYNADDGTNIDNVVSAGGCGDGITASITMNSASTLVAQVGSLSSFTGSSVTCAEDCFATSRLSWVYNKAMGFFGGRRLGDSFTIHFDEEGNQKLIRGGSQ